MSVMKWESDTIPRIGLLKNKLPPPPYFPQSVFDSVTVFIYPCENYKNESIFIEYTGQMIIMILSFLFLCVAISLMIKQEEFFY